MEHSIRRRLLSKKILLSLIFITFVNTGAADVYFGGSHFYLSEEARSGPTGLKGGVKDDIAYDPRRGIKVGTREIQYSKVKDQSNYRYNGVGVLYEAKGWDTSLSVMSSAVNLTVGSKWWYLLYGVHASIIRQKYTFEIEHHEKNYYCVISCSYASTMTSQNQSEETQEKEELVQIYSPYFGFYYKYKGFNFRPTVDPKTFNLFVGYNF